jgi:alkylation response protein AidB-like acyl-CoA dehydrogenase
MTEPAVASSDATNITCSIAREGDEYVINGHKWFISGALHPHCRLLIVMGKTDFDAAPHNQQSMVLVPMDTPGVKVLRNMLVFGYDDAEGHVEMTFEDVRVPVSNLLGEEGGGFAIAQARLGPGRIHHCMRALGAAERTLALLCARGQERIAFGQPLVNLGGNGDVIADLRIGIEQARLLTLKAAWTIDTQGVKAAMSLISQIKVVVPTVLQNAADAAIQIHGAAGLSEDTPLAALYAYARTLRLADGPDAVHRALIAKLELREQAAHREARA